MTTSEKLIDAIKLFAKGFLLDAGEFYPFGIFIDNDDKIVPVSTHSEDDMPESQELIDVFEKYFRSKSESDYKLAGLGVDVLLTIKCQKFDALQIRLFEDGKEVSEMYLKYTVNTDNVEFSN